MSIFNYFGNITLTNDQQKALEKIEAFLKSDREIFILKGYAGTGKTSLLKGLVKYIHDFNRTSQLMAPTGRAAKVIRDVTGLEVTTIHRGIYNLSDIEILNVDSEDESEKSIKYYFPIKKSLTSDNRICIIDESSMISENKSPNELFSFGSDRLLSDLLEYNNIGKENNKIIFIGDPAQLPPVTDSKSNALDKNYFSKLGIDVDKYELKEVIRQSANSKILENATRIRDLIGASQRSKLQFEFDSSSMIDIDPEKTAQKYVEEFPTPQIGNGVVISFSNKQCLFYNQAIREKLFPNKPFIVPGDIILVCNNNYHTYETEILNGDLAMVLNVDENTESQTAPVYINVDGKRIKKNITLNFRNITIRLPFHQNPVKCKIIDSLLSKPFRDLTIPELKALFINFNIRFNKQQKIRKEKGLPTFKQGSDYYKELLYKDPYLNALRVKYGYAITCHKAQGGEWDTAFINFSGRIGLSDSHLRWGYTALTRAAKKVYTINPPYFTEFNFLNFTAIGNLTKVPENAIYFGEYPLSPFHNKTDHPTKHLKYFEVLDKIEGTPYSISKVDSSQFQEMYYITDGENKFRFDAYHNKAGFFRKFERIEGDQDEVLEEILNKMYHQEISLNYNPSNEILEILYNKLQMHCSELGITILNIEEKIQNYFVRYYFKTDAECALIQFALNSRSQITTAQPKSLLGNNDFKLKELIKKLTNVI